ncbi:hypothetical protein EMCRGX_G006838 [Ephydatia muelleri]
MEDVKKDIKEAERGVILRINQLYQNISLAATTINVCMPVSTTGLEAHSHCDRIVKEAGGTSPGVTVTVGYKRNRSYVFHGTLNRVSNSLALGQRRTAIVTLMSSDSLRVLMLSEIDSESFDSENGSVADGEENDSYPNGDILSCISAEYDTDGCCSSPAAPTFSPLPVYSPSHSSTDSDDTQTASEKDIAINSASTLQPLSSDNTADSEDTQTLSEMDETFNDSSQSENDLVVTSGRVSK